MNYKIIKGFFWSFVKYLNSTRLCLASFTFDLAERKQAEISPGIFLSTHRKRLFFYAVSIALLVSTAVFSRYAQYDVMINEPATYLLNGLHLLSTTNDSGYFLYGAVNALKLPYLPLPGYGELPSYLLALIAKLVGVSVDVAGVYLVYISASLTALSVYLLFGSLRQAPLGFLVALGVVFFFPVYSRTSVGMIDTDLLNLFFVTSILAFLNFSASSSRFKFTTGFAIVAGSLNYLFALWYPRPGFLIAFLVVYFALLIRYSVPRRHVFVSLLTFSILSGPYQIEYAFTSLVNFVGLYVDILRVPLEPGSLSSTVGLDLPGLIYPTISEIQPLSLSVVYNDFGNPIVFVMCLVGALLWAIRDLTRFLVTGPFWVFLVLYFISGYRFSFYAAPLLVAGGICSILSILYFVGRMGSRYFHGAQVVDGSGLNVATRLTAPSISVLVGKQELGIFIGLLSLALAWPINVFPPPGTVPPPVIPARELQDSTRLLSSVPNNAVLVSWWDYGHELRYRTGLNVIADGNRPASVRSVYLARALISTSPEVAADEFRFASYFSEEVLSEYFPRRPPIEHAVDIGRDIFIYIPSSLMSKMNVILGIASSTLSPNALQGFDARDSTFSRLFHNTPLRYGDFELVLVEEGGARLYRLRGLANK